VTPAPEPASDPRPPSPQKDVRPSSANLPTVALDPAVVAASAQSAAAAGRQPPEVIAGYRRVRAIGSGGMAQVFEAVHQQLGRRIALKLLKPAVADNPDFNLRFLRESHAMATVSHPNVVAIHDAGEADGFMYMALEFVNGGDLSRLLKRRGTLEADQALDLMIGCAKGLGAIHAAGLVHRDIKPANIFLDQDGQPKIGDLGLARAADGEDRMTMTGTSWGTPSYMSPEQIKGIADIDIRSDIYALGATLYTLLTGHEPFTGETSYVITHRVLTEPVPDPRGLNSLIPPAVSAVVLKAMAKDRAKRYQTPQEMIEDLERARSGQRLLHTAALTATPPASGPGNTAMLVGAQVALRRPSSGGGRTLPTLDPRVLKLVALMVVGGVLVLAWWSMQGMQLGPRQAGDAGPAWATLTGKDAHGAWATLTVGAVPLRLRHCPAGSFAMGSPEGEPGRQASESPHPVTLRRGFWMLDTECPQALYLEVVGSNPSTNQGPTLPVEGVSWQEAVDFCKALAKRDIPARLPTEAEWEYACRAGSAEPFALKGDPGTFAWIAHGDLLKAWREAAPEEAEDSARRYCARIGQDPALRPQPVGSLAANAFGLHDLHGNVLEWCADAWDGRTPYGSVVAVDPEETAGGLSIARGGCWFYPPERCRSASRLGLKPTAMLNYVGFRFVIPDPPPSL
jgi:formylglycine-generating enzyme required for sulfatase activity